jgi:hypothetical protein
MSNIFTKSVDRFDAFVEKHSARLLSGIGMAGDAATIVSGYLFENIGRAVSGVFGVAAITPMMLFTKKELKKGEVDPQDLPFLKRMANIWKFWKYPIEFWAVGNLLQSVGMALFSGPDTVSKFGEATGTNLLLSQDSFRLAETVYGAGIVATNFVTAMVAESGNPQEDNRPKGLNPLPKIRYDFAAAGNFIADRGRELVSEGFRLDKGFHEAVLGGYTALSVAGPNKVMSRSFNYVLFPWMAESAFRNDWNNVAAGGLYYFANYLFGRTSKRAAQREESSFPAPAVA